MTVRPLVSEARCAATVVTLIAVSLSTGCFAQQSGNTVSPANRAEAAPPPTAAHSTARPPAADPYDELLDQLERFMERTCTCKDMACAEQVDSEWRVYAAAKGEELGKDARPNAHQHNRGETLDAKRKQCAMALQQAAS